MIAKEYHSSKKVLFAISSLGLGHATRNLPIINYFLKKGYKISIISHGNALSFLKEEIKSNSVSFILFNDYPPIERGQGLVFYFYLLKDILNIVLIIKEEHKKINKMKNEFDLIFSDGRYGVYSENIPSFVIAHQVSFRVPKRLRIFKGLADYFNYVFLKKFDCLFIPDFKNKDNNLAGGMSHNRILKKLNHKYIGLLSSYKKLNLKKDIDYLFVISGYLLEYKNKFISELIEQAKFINGKKVFVLGDVSNKKIEELKEFNITIYPSAVGKLRERLFNRAKIIISRAGYTTIMDLVELNKKAILFPTPNQTEQEYLAGHLKNNDSFVICKNQNNFNLKNLIEELSKKNKRKQFSVRGKTDDSLKKIEKNIESYLNENYFSIIIPARNEENYIKNTIEKISEFNYNPNKYEIIVVENDSSDKTFEILLDYENKISNLKIYQGGEGVSAAKNLGLSKINPNSDWVIFLDADTILEKNFLRYLNNYLNKSKNQEAVIGTTQIYPSDSDTFYSKLWFKFYNFGHKITNTSFSIQIAKTSIAKKVKFDENLNFSEDLKFIKESKKLGKFFFFKAQDVSTSTRRFKNDGYIKTFFKWNFQAFLPERIKKGKKYKIMR